MTNILFIHQSAELYGSDKTLLLLLQNLDRSKFFPVVVVPFLGPLVLELEKEHIKVVVSPVLKLSRKMFAPKNLMRFYKDIQSAVKTLGYLNAEHKFDLVYSNTLAVLAGLIFARKRKIKHLWHVHEIIEKPKLFTALFVFCLNRTANTQIVYNSFASQKFWEAKGATSQKATVVRNGLPEMSMAIETEIKKTRSELFLADNEIVVTLVGRISKIKGQKLVLNTIIKYFKLTNNIKFLFVGSPVTGQEEYLKEIEDVIGSNNLHNKIKIIPYIKDLKKIWAITDIAIVPSVEAESFGLVALEAMLNKKPVIGSNLGGLIEIIINNVTGFLFEPNNKTELAEALNKLIENPELRKQMGQNGYERACAEFSVSGYVSGFEDLFDRIMGR